MIMSEIQEKSLSLEQAMDRLDQLAREMEEGQLPLEVLIARYDEGTKLVQLCQEKLDAAEKKIQIIARSQSGPAGVEDFRSGTDES